MSNRLKLGRFALICILVVASFALCSLIFSFQFPIQTPDPLDALSSGTTYYQNGSNFYTRTSAVYYYCTNSSHSGTNKYSSSSSFSGTCYTDEVTCSTCNGNGYYYTYSSRKVTCSATQTVSSKEACPQCYGSGVLVVGYGPHKGSVDDSDPSCILVICVYCGYTANLQASGNFHNGAKCSGNPYTCPCSYCGGEAYITVYNSITCSTCNGNGYYYTTDSTYHSCSATQTSYYNHSVSSYTEYTYTNIDTGATTTTTSNYSTASGFTITFNANNGSGTMDSQYYLFGHTQALKSNAYTRTNYKFLGWATSASGAVVYTDGQSISISSGSNITLYAVWELLSYTVNLDNQSATVAGSTSVTATITLAMPAITLPTKTGYTFGGYYTGTDGTGTQYYTSTGASARNYDISGSTTLFALWTPNTYSVTLNTNDGTINSGNVTEYTYNTGATLPTDVTRTGYTFAGWYADSDFSGSAVTEISATDIDAKTYYAKWTANTYSVTLNTNGGTIISGNVTSYTYNTGANLPTNVTRTGYTFAGWYESSAFSGSVVTQITATDIGAKTYYAKWTTNTYTVTINPNGGSYNGSTANSAVSGSYGTTTTVADPTREGYTFAGWVATKTQYDAEWMQILYHNNVNGTQLFDKNVDLATTIVNDMYKNSQFAIFGNLDFATYEFLLQYDHLGNQYNRWTQTSNPAITSEAVTGYNAVHINWNAHGLSGGSTFGGIAKSSASASGKTNTFVDGTVGHGNWYYALGSYNAWNGGIPGPNSVEKNVVRLWFRLDGTEPAKIFRDADALGSDNTYYFKSETVTLKALWLKNATITLNAMGGSGGTATISVAVSDTLPNIDVPTRTGYTFGGYWTSQNGTGEQIFAIDGTPAMENSIFTADTTIYANWVANSYSVTLNANGGTINSGNVTSYTYNTTTTLPTNVTRTGYTFAGWYVDSDFSGSAVTQITTTDIGAKTYYAKWTANTYTVNLNVNGGTINSGNVTSYTYNTTTTLPTNVTRTGYTFAGWYESSTFSGSAVTSISSTDTGNKTYYAKWNANTYTLYFNHSPYQGMQSAQQGGFENGGWRGGTFDTTHVRSGKYAYKVVGSSTLWEQCVYTTNAFNLDSTNKDHIFYVRYYGYQETRTTNGYTQVYWPVEEPSFGRPALGEAGQWNLYSYRMTRSSNPGTASKTMRIDFDNNKNEGTIWWDDYMAYDLTEIFGAGNEPSKEYCDELFDIQVTSSTATYNSTLANVAVPTRTGYIFCGYYTGASGTGTQIYDSNGKSVVSVSNFATDTTLYAKWIQNSYSITLYINGGTINSGNVTSYTYGEGATLPTDVSKLGYTFGGWYTDSSFSGKPVTTISAKETGARTYYAKWNLVRMYYYNSPYEGILDARTGGFENGGWSDAVYDTTHVRTGEYSCKLVSTASLLEITLSTAKYYQIDSTNKDHLFYFRFYGYQEEKTQGATTEIFWPIQEPSTNGILLGDAGQWNLYSYRTTRSNNPCTTSRQAMRIDFNNHNVAGVFWVDDFMVYDLTEIFGAGNEPSKDYCDRFFDAQVYSNELIYGSSLPTITPPTKTGYIFGGYYTGTNGHGHTNLRRERGAITQ